jgi:hypothetical protein
MDMGTRWMVTDPHVLARHTAVVTQLQTLCRDQEEQERREQTYHRLSEDCLRLPRRRCGRDVRTSVDAGAEWIGLVEGVMRKIAGS